MINVMGSKCVTFTFFIFNFGKRRPKPGLLILLLLIQQWTVDEDTCCVWTFEGLLCGCSEYAICQVTRPHPTNR